MPTADNSCAAYIAFKKNRVIATAKPAQGPNQTTDYSTYTGYKVGAQAYIVQPPEEPAVTIPCCP